MKELQMLVNKWKYEADDIKNKNGAAVNFAAMPIAAEWRRLRKCITEAQLLLDEVTKSDTPPQLNKHDVIRWLEIKKQKPENFQMIIYKTKDGRVGEGEYRGDDWVKVGDEAFPFAWWVPQPTIA